MTATLPAITETGPGLVIPRVFHRIWLGGPLPDRERRYGETWVEHHPGWEMRLWHDGNLPPLVNQAQFDAATSPAQKADILRYELLLAHGGVYLDTDFECFRNIEPLLAGVRAFCGREDGVLATNSILGCVPGHPFLSALVASVPDSIAWLPGRPPNEQTGPVLLTRVLIEQEALGLEVPTVFGPELFFPYHYTEPHRAGEHFPNAYAAHHWAKSWHTTSKEPTVTATATRGDVVRVIVEIDPDRFTEAGAVVLASALQAVGAVARAELALVVRGVAAVTPELREALSGIVTTVAPASSLPEITIHGEADGRALESALRVLVDDNPTGAASAVLALSRWAAGDTAADKPAAPALPAPVPAAPAGGTAEGAGTAAVYVGGGRLLVRTAWGDKLYCDAADLSLTPDLALTGVFDPKLCAFISRWLRPGDTAVDVGANIGALTVLMARVVGHTGRILAYEANPHIAALLRDNVSVNYRNDWVEIREQAAWSEQARLTFHVSRRFQGNGSLLAHDDWYAGHFRVDTHDEVEVDAVPLDPTLRELRPRLVKIDVEGAEPDVLAGMAGWLDEARDTVIAVEVVRNRMQDRWELFSEQLRRLVGTGWQLMLLDDAGTPYPVELAQVLEVGWFDNVLLAR